MDPDNPENGLTVPLAAGYKLTYPNAVHTTENASRIIFADLDDLNTMWTRACSCSGYGARAGLGNWGRRRCAG